MWLRLVNGLEGRATLIEVALEKLYFPKTCLEEIIGNEIQSTFEVDLCAVERVRHVPLPMAVLEDGGAAGTTAKHVS